MACFFCPTTNSRMCGQHCGLCEQADAEETADTSIAEEEDEDGAI